MALRALKDNDVVAEIKIQLYSDGAMSISGNIGDVKLALGMIDHARARVADKLPKELDGQLVIPNGEVHVRQHPLFPTLPNGDMRT